MPRNLPILILTLLTFAACRPSRQSISDYRYFDKHLDSLNQTVVSLTPPRIQNHDQLAIVVSSASLNQQQVQIFNLMAASPGAGGAASGGYLVDYDGAITMPVIGKVPASGLTKEELAADLIKRLSPYVKDPVVNIRFLNYRVMMLGEVRQTGWITFPNEKATVVDAIGQAGGLTEQGLRNNILLIRTQPDGRVETHRFDINDARIYRSPLFQLQQNDVVYVLPNDSKLIQYERANSPFFRDSPVYLGLLTSIFAFVAVILAVLR